MTESAAGESPGSRRQLFTSAVAAGFVLAGCGHSGSLHSRVKDVGAVAPADVRTLNRLLDLEHLMIAAYTASIPLLAPDAAEAAKRFLGQELSHAGELSGLVKQAGGKPHKPMASYDLGSPGGSVQVLALLHRIERAQLAAYVEVLPTLSQPKVRAATAAVMANDAQHVSVLRAKLGLSPLPSPFVTGRE